VGHACHPHGLTPILTLHHFTSPARGEQGARSARDHRLGSYGRRPADHPRAVRTAAECGRRTGSDDIEWVGHRPTFALVTVDRATQTRAVKPSARRFGEIARTGMLGERDE
jgi:beta-glucosidase/6-phospho-beta-glucosidase/beta-galactosidase